MFVQESRESPDLVDEARRKLILVLVVISPVYYLREKLYDDMLTGSMAISRLPNPWWSGKEGCAPTSTLFSLASNTVLSIIMKSLNQRVSQ